MKIRERTYLGDGVYVYHDGYHVWLITSNGITDTNEIALEPSVLKAFQEWIAGIESMVEASDV